MEKAIVFLVKKISITFKRIIYLLLSHLVHPKISYLRLIKKNT